MCVWVADRCLRIPCREARTEELTACHTQQLVAKVAAMSEAASASGREIGVERTYFTSDTYVRPGTSRCARLAAGGCIEVATAVARYLPFHYLNACFGGSGCECRRASQIPWLTGDGWNFRHQMLDCFAAEGS